MKDHSLLARDFKTGQIPRGPIGPVGPAGPAGPAGPGGPAGTSGASARWALIRPDGSIASQSGEVSLSAHSSAGNYILNFGSVTKDHLILATGAYATDTSDQRGETTAGPCGGGDEGRNCPSTLDDTSHVWVQTRDSAASPSDHSFYIAVFG